MKYSFIIYLADDKPTLVVSRGVLMWLFIRIKKMTSDVTLVSKGHDDRDIALKEGNKALGIFFKQ